jgi:hypothetical protein
MQVSEPLVLRQTLWIRIYIALVGVAMIAVLAVYWLNVSSAVGVAVGLIVTLYGAFVCYRVFALRMSTDGDTLFLRNYMSTRRIPRADIERFTVGRSAFGLPLGRTIFVNLTNERVVTVDASLRLGVGKKSVRVQSERVAKLEAWRKSGS